MTTLTNGRVTVEVADDRAEHFATVLGMSIVENSSKEPEPVVSEPRKPRGRPKKASS